MVTFQNPTPSHAMKTPITAMVGSARPIEDVPRAKKSPRCRCPSQSPSGTAITRAIAERGERELRRLGCLLQQQRGVVGDELERVDEEGGDHQRIRLHGVRARWRSASSASAPSASRIARAPPATSSVRKMSGCSRASKIGAAEAVVDEIGGDRGDRDRGHRRDPQAGHDRRHRERQLDAEERLSARQPHPPRRLEHLRRARRAGRRGCSDRGRTACRRRAGSRSSSR